MTETEFRFMHSQLMEYYQYIEWRLKALLAESDADDEVNWYMRLEEYNKGRNTLGKLFHMVLDKYENIFTEEEIEEFERLIENRNYWCHMAFGGNEPIVFIGHRGEKEKNVGRSCYAVRLKQDLDDAVEWDERLTRLG